MAKSKQKQWPRCAECDLETNKRICMTEKGLHSKGCPTLTHKEVLAKANAEYEHPEIREFAYQASRQEAECYANRHERPYVMQPSKTRIIEICEFAQKMGYKRLGLVFCVGLALEAAKVAEIFKIHGFDVVSVLCKAGRTSKDKIGLKDEEKIYQGTDEAMCNPIYQAFLLNHEQTELNVLLGLCVGHDSLFFKYAEAPTTVLAVKDRVTGHNPLAAVYLSDSYYRRIKQ
ncbi:MAG: DUF1847 domain-containing protein [Deltaproteobacteria bacterium]|nr:DUF1847 domain-containing protein [Deltaproteobacteria bacterium]